MGSSRQLKGEIYYPTKEANTLLVPYCSNSI